jgi:nucleoside-diphosphate-sugar epimerase
MILKDKSKPVLVIGANGYIGSWITKELLDNN